MEGDVTLARYPDQERSVVGFLEAIIHAAEVDADRVIAFLIQQGVKPLSPSMRPVPSDVVPTGPVADMLLNVAAALRLRAWERAGLRPFLPSDLPHAYDALRVAADCYLTAESDVAQRRKIPLKVFQVWISRFAHHGQKDLGADVVLDNNGGDEVIRAVALFLWKNRNLSTKYRMEENKNGSKNNEER